MIWYYHELFFIYLLHMCNFSVGIFSWLSRGEHFAWLNAGVMLCKFLGWSDGSGVFFSSVWISLFAIPFNLTAVRDVVNNYSHISSSPLTNYLQLLDRLRVPECFNGDAIKLFAIVVLIFQLLDRCILAGDCIPRPTGDEDDFRGLRIDWISYESLAIRASRPEGRDVAMIFTDLLFFSRGVDDCDVLIKLYWFLLTDNERCKLSFTPNLKQRWFRINSFWNAELFDCITKWLIPR